MDLTDRIILITGATGGIGRGLVNGAVDAGAGVIAAGRNEEKLQHLVQDFGSSIVDTVCVDLEDAESTVHSFEHLSDRTSRVDALINNAGGGPPLGKSLRDSGWSAWERSVRVNLLSVLNVTSSVLPALRNGKAPSIVNVSSSAGRRYARASHAVYTAAKAGVIGITRQLAFELGPDGIRVNCVAPGTTPSGERVRTKLSRLTDEQLDDLQSAIPLEHRFGEVGEIVAPILFLAGKTSTYITGATLDVDGGFNMG